MGIQIMIETVDLIKSGWQLSQAIDPEIRDDWTDEVIYPESHHLVIHKGDYEFHSYAPDCFSADCNAWGSNRALFEKAGLMDIPHILS